MRLARLLRAVKQRDERPICLLLGGETTVTIRGNGLGGRSQELALAAAFGLIGSKDCLLLSAGSDGTDGLTDAAGAVVDGTTIERAAANKMNAAKYLYRNDSHTIFKALDDLIITGPTLTNVMDIVIIMKR